MQPFKLKDAQADLRKISDKRDVLKLKLDDNLKNNQFDIARQTIGEIETLTQAIDQMQNITIQVVHAPPSDPDEKLKAFARELDALCSRYQLRICSHVEHMIAIVDVEHRFSFKFENAIKLPIGKTDRLEDVL